MHCFPNGRNKTVTMQVLERLNDALPNPDPHLKQKFEEYENRALDPAAERRLRLVLEQWTEMERGLDTEMQIIKTDLKQVQHNVSGGFQRVVEQLSEQKELITASFEKGIYFLWEVVVTIFLQ